MLNARNKVPVLPASITYEDLLERLSKAFEDNRRRAEKTIFRADPPIVESSHLRVRFAAPTPDGRTEMAVDTIVLLGSDLPGNIAFTTLGTDGYLADPRSVPAVQRMLTTVALAKGEDPTRWGRAYPDGNSLKLFLSTLNAVRRAAGMKALRGWKSTGKVVLTGAYSWPTSPPRVTAYLPAHWSFVGGKLRIDDEMLKQPVMVEE
jgi:hypothetical protein